MCCGLAVAFSTYVCEADTTKEQCVKANTDGQTFRLDGKLSAARARFDACSDASCPDLVRNDCVQRRNELDRAQPTIVFDVKDANGGDVSAVSVSVDGHPLSDKLDGRALPVDPGEHTFAFAATGAPLVSKKFVIKEGQKDRRERVDLALGTAAPSTPSPAPEPTQTTTPPSSTTDTGSPDAETPPPADSGGGMSFGRKLGLVAGGLGIAGIAVGSIFGIMTFSASSQQNTDCPGSTCSGSNRASAQNDHNDATTDGTVSTVGFIAGGALLATGVALYLLSPATTDASAPASTGLTILPSLGPGGAGAFLRGAF